MKYTLFILIYFGMETNETDVFHYNMASLELEFIGNIKWNNFHES
jgi:hypothetical protein